MTPSVVRNKYIIRFCVNSEHARKEDILIAWDIIKEYAAHSMASPTKERPPLTRQKSKRFSFTRSISKEMYQRSLSRSNLLDGATPILVADSDEEDVVVEDTSIPPDEESVIEGTTILPDEEEKVFTKEFVDGFRINEKEIKYNGVS